MPDAPKAPFYVPSPAPSLTVPAAPPAQMPEKITEKSGIFGHNRAFSGTQPEVDPQFGLSNDQARAIELALQGCRWGEIATAIRVDPKTLWRWRNENTQFQLALENTRAHRLETSNDRAHSSADEAVEILCQVMADPNHPHRVRAAQIVLNHDIKLRPKPVSPSQSDDDDWPEPQLDPKVG